MASNTHIGELLKAEEEAVATVTAARKGEGCFAWFHLPKEEEEEEKNLTLLLSFRSFRSFFWYV